MAGPRILLIIGGGIAAYKSCELVRLIRKHGGSVTCVLTNGGSQFVTAMTLAALSENPVHTTLWDLKNEVEMGHIQLSRQADLVVVCPATADLLAKMASGIADDLATTLLLATDKPVLAVPAMNVRMWDHAATRRNVDLLRRSGVAVIDPDDGEMACGEYGPGRLPEPVTIWRAIAAALDFDPGEDDLYAPIEPEHAGDYDPWTDPANAEPEESRGFGLGGLLSSLISRSTPRREPEPDEIDVYAIEAVPVPGGDEPEPPEPAPEVLPEGDLPAPVAGGPLLVRKGKAKAAPPTDPEAMNHLVAGSTAGAPEPLEGDEQPVSVGDLLAGEPEFEEEPKHRPLLGKHILITAGPTHEPIDPVRYIANRSSGRQGYAIAAAAAAAGAQVTLVSGPVSLDTPPGVDRINVETAQEMADMVRKILPVDAAIMVAAVADWRTKSASTEKIKKRGSAPPALQLEENPDILASVAAGKKRPKLLIGFAAETEDVIANARTKRLTKGADWIVANDVSGGVGDSVMGGKDNTVHLVTADQVDSWEEMPKEEVARRLIARVADAFA